MTTENHMKDVYDIIAKVNEGIPLEEAVLAYPEQYQAALLFVARKKLLDKERYERFLEKKAVAFERKERILREKNGK